MEFRKTRQLSLNKKNSKDEVEQLRKEKMVSETRLRYEKANEDYKYKLETKLAEIDERKKKKKKRTEKDLIKKYNYLTMMREDNYEKTVRFEKIQDYVKRKKMEKINERMNRIDIMQ